MDTLQCAVVLGKLERFEWELAQRKRLGGEYRRLLQQDFGDTLELLEVKPDRDCVWAQYTVKVHNREAVQEALKRAGVPTAVHYPRPLHQQPAYATSQIFVHSEAMARRVMSLPMSADMTAQDQALVVKALTAALESSIRQ
jgi:UDP-2-acetamido-2-deoxy-ribo-hexuluronate aminotransferase